MTATLAVFLDTCQEMQSTAAQILGLGIEARHSYTRKPSGLLLLLATFIVAELRLTICLRSLHCRVSVTYQAMYTCQGGQLLLHRTA